MAGKRVTPAGQPDAETQQPIRPKPTRPAQTKAPNLRTQPNKANQPQTTKTRHKDGTAETTQLPNQTVCNTTYTQAPR